MKNRLYKILALSLAFVALSVLMPACAKNGNVSAQSPIVVTDQFGRQVSLAKYPERIVSISPSNTEILFALGLGDKIVGVDDYSDYPAAAKEKPKIGGYSNSDIERIVALKPDLVLIDEIQTHDILPELDKLGITSFTLNPRSLDQILDSITLTGKITGKDKEAGRLVSDMNARIKVITDKTKGLPDAQRPGVFYLIWHDPIMSVGTDTWHHEMIQMAGGKNTIQNPGFPTVSLESFISFNPQIIITSTGMGDGANLPYQFATTEPRLAGVDARANNRVYQMNADIIERPGPRIIDGLEALAKMIHPEIFGK